MAGIEYLGANLDAIYHAEGRCTPNGATAFHYEYTLKDHLGNARVNFRANGTAVTFLEEMHYYPFGMQMEGMGTQNPANKYLYNGKELNDDLGLNWSDYGARWYDAALGRWWSVDPLSEKYISLSAYTYVDNNPINLYDPDGMRIAWDKEMSKEDKRQIKKHIRYLRKNSDTFNKMWKSLKKSDHTHTVHAVHDDNMKVVPEKYSSEGSSTDIYRV